MPRSKQKPTPWTDEQIKQVEGLLTSFNSDRHTVAACMECRIGDLDILCRDAFGLNFDRTAQKYALVGRARIRSALFKAAEHGNAKALDTLVREQLGAGPVETRRRVAAKAKAEQTKAEEVDF